MMCYSISDAGKLRKKEIQDEPMSPQMSHQMTTSHHHLCHQI